MPARLATVALLLTGIAFLGLMFTAGTSKTWTHAFAFLFALALSLFLFFRGAEIYLAKEFFGWDFLELHGTGAQAAGIAAMVLGSIGFVGTVVGSVITFLL